MNDEKNELEQLKEKLFVKKRNAGVCAADESVRADEWCEGYKAFLNEARTERLATAYFIRNAEKRGFNPFDKSKKYTAGDKAYINNRGKMVMLIVFGKKSMADGLRITAAHIDSPRLDLKPAPLYEDTDAAYFKTHYYGGIKKYQWSAIPLALHGVVVKKDGTAVIVSVGGNLDEPCFVVTDLLPHLAKDQMKRPLDEGIRGEELNILVGSRPFKGDEGSEAVKLNIMNILFEKYGITEADFSSAELEAVPAFPAVDIGFDRSMIGSYGHDDRVCAYPSAMALFDTDKPDYTSVCILADKEEVGSMGNTGLESSFLEYAVCDLADTQGLCGRDVLRASKCLSADVNACYDPTFASSYEKNNSALLNCGVAVTKYLGSRGKSGSSDASAEFMAFVRELFDREGVVWQTGELGKVDEGGGGTVSQYVANKGVEVVDVGVPVLSMHSPFEVVAKLDVYMTYKGVKAFYK